MSDTAPALLLPAAQLYARAFFADPLMAHYLPDPTLRAEVLPTFMHLALRYCQAHGEISTASGPNGLEGVACWLPPGHTALEAWGMFRASLGVVTLRQAWRILRSFSSQAPGSPGSDPNRSQASFLQQVSAAETKIDTIHRRIAPGPHWYLMILGVEPACQGQGVGSRLIAPALARARSTGLTCYLETMTERDVSFYRKSGFTVAHDTDLLPGLHMWAMTYPA